MAAGVASAGLTAVGGGSPADIVKSGLMAYAGASAISAMSSAAGVPPGTPGGPPPVSPEALPPTVTPDGLPDAVPAPQAPPVINSVGNAQQLLSSPPPSVSPTGGAASLYRPGDEFMNTTPAPSVSPEATAPPPQVSAEPNLSAPNPAVSAPAPVPQGAPAPNAPIGGTGTNGIGDLATKASDAVFGHTPTSAEISAEAVKLQQVTPGLSTDKAIDIATKNLTPSTLRSVVPATLLGGALLSKTSLTQHTPVDNNPLGLKPKTSADYMAENPQFAAWENGWKTAGAAPTPQAPGPTTMTPTTMAQFSPYTLPALNQAPRPAVNQPYNTAGLYGLYGQPTQQMNMGGPVNDAHTSGSGMQQGLTNAFNGGGGMSSNGGIGALSPSSFAEGGNTHYPRRTGPIDGPGTGTSDSIPAMLSDGEFVFTAKAVKRAGNGSRREGAKRMYQLMHMLEHGGKV